MTKTIKKSVAFLSAAVMVMAMLLYFPGETFRNIDWGLKSSAAGTEPQATDEASVTINGETLYYATLEEAFSAASGKTATITMLNDAECSSTSGSALLVANNSNITLNMNGKTLSGKGKGTVGIITLNKGSLSVQGPGTMKSTFMCLSCQSQNAKMTVENITFDVSEADYGVWVASSNTVTLNNIQIIGKAKIAAVYQYSNSANVTINNMNAIDGGYSDVCFKGNILKINGGTFDKISVNSYYVASITSVSQVLGEGCIYRNNEDQTWVTSDLSNTLEISNVTVEKIPLTINPEAEATPWYYNSAEHSLQMNAQPTTTGNEITYEWYDGDKKLECVSDTYTVPKTMPIGSYTYTCKATCDGYTLSHDFTFTVEECKHKGVEITFNSNGFGNCPKCNATVYQPATLNGSNYEIGNAGQLYWFAALVNGDSSVCDYVVETNPNGIQQDTAAKAVLTADITVNTGVLDSNGNLVTNTSSFTIWTPIGKSSKQYTGTFDGRGHTISGLYFNNQETDYVGLFGYVGSGGKISNVGVVDSYFNGKNYVGGVCGDNDNGTIENCYNTGAVNGSGFVGGVCGKNDNGGTITNCYNTGNVSGTGDYVGSVCGQNDNGTIANCYYLADTATGGVNSADDAANNVLSKITDNFKSGEVAYLLSQGCTVGGTIYNGDVWGQDLSETTNYPVLDSTKKVYQNLTYAGCEGKPGEPVKTEYSNTQLDPVYADHTDGDEDGKCDTCSKYMDNIGARLVGHSLTLDGSVGVNFYMELSSEVISDSNAYMEFTLPGGKTSTVKVSEAPTEVISGTTYYKFKCQVNATAMTDTITAQIKSTVGNSKVYEYTVKEYADYLFEHQGENTEFAKAAELIEAMVNYGSYAQIYAGYNTEKLAVGDAKNLKSLDDVWISEYYEPSIYETKVQFAGANLSLLSTTTLRMYFKITDIDAESVLIGYQGQALEKTQSGDYYYVELVGIPASKLDDEFCIDVGDGSTNFIVTYTPMAYCTSVVHRETTETRTEDLKNLIKALVLYNRAADAYISEN